MLALLARLLRPAPKPFGELPRLQPGAPRSAMMWRTFSVCLLVVVAMFAASSVVDALLAIGRRPVFPRFWARGVLDEFLMTVEMVVMAVAAVLLARLLIRPRGAQLFPFARPRLDRLVIVLSIAVLVIDMTLGFLINAGGAEVPQWINWPPNRAAAFILAFNTVILAPITEEIVFRGLLQGAVRASFGVGWSLVVPTALFALMHFEPTLIYPLYLLPGSLIIAIARELSGDLTPPIIIHMISNGVAMLALASGSN